MADLDILVRDKSSGGAFTASPQVTTTAASVNDYILIVASDDFIAPTDLTIGAAPAGVGSWTQLLGATNTNMDVKAWIAPVTSAGTKTITVNQNGNTSGLHIQWFILNPQGGTIALDGTATTHADNTSPYTQGAVSPVGSKSMLFCATGVVQFGGVTLAFGAAPSGMTAQANYLNANSGLQVCWQSLTSAGTTGTRDQTSNVPTGSATTGGGSVAGGMFALRNQIADVPSSGPEAGRFLIAY